MSDTQLYKGTRPACPESKFPGIINLVEVISLGFMMGTALVFPNIKYTGPFYHYLTIGIFSVSFLVHNLLHWRVVTRLFCPVLVMVSTSVGLFFFWTDIPVVFFLDRIPLLAMFTSLVALGLDKYRDLIAQYLLRTQPSTARPGQPTYGRTLPGMPDTRTHLDIKENNPDRTLAFMQGAEKGLPHPLSERSSDLSLQAGELESLPSSWDHWTRGFFVDSPTRGDQSVDEDISRGRMSV
ncbi:hypothetical protein F5X99DRAFT_192313 [Biscogniauxia marginata]|nr:hypothetical protein F5X99DRAFT_192313 [Biscogniauxia marginata]